MERKVGQALKDDERSFFSNREFFDGFRDLIYTERRTFCVSKIEKLFKPEFGLVNICSVTD